MIFNKALPLESSHVGIIDGLEMKTERLCGLV